MELKMVSVGIFWVIPDEVSGQRILEFKKDYGVSDADRNGFINYPYSHYETWCGVNGLGGDCYKYPRGRVIYNAKLGKHRIFADECVWQSTIENIAKLFDIEDYELYRDEHYVCSFCSVRRGGERPTLNYNILRGRNKIGENLIEITYGKTKILVELGKALDGGDELSDLEKTVLNTKYNAVVASHYHADHAGLIEYKTDCPIYIGSGAYRILQAMNEYRAKRMPNNITTYKNGKAFTVDGVRITPFLCDHSAFDSYMLLFEAGGKSILYTGDFRFHGRKDKDKLLAALPKYVNVLIHEGTNAGSDKPCFTESELEDRLVDIMSKNGPVFVIQSATNMDRLVSVYRAAKRTNRILYEDNYAALMTCAAGGKIPRPDVFSDVYAYTPRYIGGRRKDLFLELENKRGIRDVVRGKKFVMIVRASMLGYMQKLSKAMSLTGATLVYSMWSGYKSDPTTAEFLRGVGDMGVDTVDVHTSGHASNGDILLLKQTVSAGEYVAVHTCVDCGQ
ncbi:MAG: hypothetical protein K2F90_00755 [Clostridiales bacterium]|nr:hypothetical protein [Clostridiales bacterium]